MAAQTDGALPARIYLVRGARRNGSVTYRCTTPASALRKLRDFIGIGYLGISVTGPDGSTMGERDLAALAGEPSIAEPVDG